MEGQKEGGLEVESDVQIWGTKGREREGGKKETRKTQKHMKQEQLNVRQESRVEPISFGTASQTHNVMIKHSNVVIIPLAQNIIVYKTLSVP